MHPKQSRAQMYIAGAVTLLVVAALVMILFPEARLNALFALGLGFVLLFEFVNGFHDTPNAAATAYGNKAFWKPEDGDDETRHMKRTLVRMGIWNFLGAMSTFFLGGVMNTIAEKLFHKEAVVPAVLFSALISAILWNIITWALKQPSSSTHALFGGLMGAIAMSPYGLSGIKQEGGINTFYSLLCSPLAAFALAYLLMSMFNWCFAKKVLVPLKDKERKKRDKRHEEKLLLVRAVYWCIDALFAKRVVSVKSELHEEVYEFSKKATARFLWWQRASSQTVAFCHGINDGQKGMAMVLLLKVAFQVRFGMDIWWMPLWLVIVLCSVAMGIGSWVGGKRIMPTLSEKLVRLDPPRGVAAELTAAIIIIFTSWVYKLSLSTTQAAASAIAGAGQGDMDKKTVWKMVAAWMLTFPFTFLFGALFYLLASLLGLC